MQLNFISFYKTNVNILFKVWMAYCAAEDERWLLEREKKVLRRDRQMRDSFKRLLQDEFREGMDYLAFREVVKERKPYLFLLETDGKLFVHHISCYTKISEVDKE